MERAELVRLRRAGRMFAMENESLKRAARESGSSDPCRPVMPPAVRQMVTDIHLIARQRMPYARHSPASPLDPERPTPR